MPPPDFPSAGLPHFHPSAPPILSQFVRPSSIRQPSVGSSVPSQAGGPAGRHLSVRMFVGQSIHQSFSLSIHSSSFRPFICPHPPPSVGLFFRPFVRACVHQSSLSVHPCVTSFACPSSFLSVCSSVLPYVSPSFRPSAHYQGIIMIPF